MGSFLPLISLEVEHSYFPGGACRGLRITPSAASAQRLDRSGCLVRATDRGLVLLFDSLAGEALRLHAGDDDDPLDIHFLAHADDAAFANYTEAVIGSQQELLMFDSRHAVPDEATGRWRLQADTRPMHSLEAAAALSRQELRVPPHFVISVRITEADVALALKHQARRCVCPLQARATVWKYYLFGDLAETDDDDLQVVDLGQACEFDAAVGERLPDGQSVLAVRSRAPIALQERSPHRFQLRRRGEGADKVLIKRLPVASPSLIHRETLGGVPTWVSEIYVHR